MADQLTLPLETVVVRCFACLHVIEGATSRAAHSAMERHYGRRHRALIDAIAGGGSDA